MWPFKKKQQSLIDWPFEAPKNQRSYMSRHILNGEPICHVYRDWEDGSWSFLPDRVTEDGDCRIVCLESAFRIDPSIATLADLPEGWKASRASARKHWIKEKDHSYPEFNSDGFYLIPVACFVESYPALVEESARRSLRLGQTVKLVFRFAHEQAPPTDYDVEWMWVRVTNVDTESGAYGGILDNDPKFERPISCGHVLTFNQLHVLNIYENHES